MPYVSDAQRRFFHTPTGMKKLGAATVAEFDAGAEVPGGLKNERLKSRLDPEKTSEPGVLSRIITDESGKTIQEIRVRLPQETKKDK